MKRSRHLLLAACALLCALSAAACKPQVKAPPKKVVVSASARDQAEDLYIQGVYAYADGKTEDAIAAWKKCLKLNPKHEKARKALAEAKAKQKEVEKLQ
jgi:tetratricopeptide (TPR) repeat protein